MNISKNSIHYKFLTERKINALNEEELPKDICGYFWTLSWGIFWSFFVFSAVTFASLGAIIFPISILTGFPIHWFGSFFSLMVLMGASVWFIVVVSTLTLVVWNLLEKLEHTKHKKPSLLIARYRAWKEKSCDFIEYKD